MKKLFVTTKWDAKRRAYMPALTRFGVVAILFACVLTLMAAVTQVDLTTQVKGILPAGNGGTGTSSASTGSSGGVVLSGSPSITTPTMTGPIFSGAIGSSIDFGTGYASVVEVANAAGGTTLNKLAKLSGAPSTALATLTSDTSGALGVVVGGAGTTGNAQIAVLGTASCVFDAATTAGDFVKISGTVAGDCSDAGSAFPSSAQVIGRVLSTNASGGTYNVVLFGPQEMGVGSSINFADAETPTGTVNGANTSFTLAHSPSGTSLVLYRNGQQQNAGGSNDYTLSAGTITYNAAPKTGDVLTAWYRY